MTTATKTKSANAGKGNGLGLGAILAQTIADEKAATLEAARRKAEAESAQAKEELERVEAFFQKAQTKFINGIINRTPIRNLLVQIGRSPRGEGDCDYTTAALLLANSSYNGEGYYLRLNNPSFRFYAPWAAFRDWAFSEGLEVYFEYAYDGGGVMSWYEMHIRPQAGQ